MISSMRPHRLHIPDSTMPPAYCVTSPTTMPDSPCSDRTSRTPYRHHSLPSPPMKMMNLGLPLADHIAEAVCNRRHSWHPDLMLYRNTETEQRSVSLLNLDPQEQEEIQVGGPRRRDPRRAPITHYSEDLETLLSLTEEEAELDPRVFSFPKEQFTPQQSHSVSVPYLYEPATRESSPSHKNQQLHSQTQAHSSLSSLLGGSTQSLRVDAELGAESWEHEDPTEGQEIKKEENREKSNGLRSLVRSLSFLGKMAKNSKLSSLTGSTTD